MEPTHSAALDAINPQKATDKISKFNDHNFMSLWLKTRLWIWLHKLLFPSCCQCKLWSHGGSYNWIIITAKWKRCKNLPVQSLANTRNTKYTKTRWYVCFTRWGVTAILCLQPRDRPWSAGLPTRHDSSNQTFVTTITSHHFPTTAHIGQKDPGPVVERLVNTHSRFL